jgi:hypothetical protein
MNRSEHIPTNNAKHAKDPTVCDKEYRWIGRMEGTTPGPQQLQLGHDQQPLEPPHH